MIDNRMLHDTELLVRMLRYMRPTGSLTEKAFCETYIEPFMGAPDEHGNYVLTIGNKPRVSFMAHYDTVHREHGFQSVIVDTCGVATSDSNCLGADDTTGVWILLGMIKHGVEGTYVIHAAEEVGCVGSEALVKSNPPWLEHTDAAISFDRYGTDSIITHQANGRTCSDEFAHSLAEVLQLPMRADSWGTYTDSNEYSAVIPECTNVSVGYDHQHTSREYQDLYFAESLLESVCMAQWHRLLISRDPTHIEPYNPYSMGYSTYRSSYDYAYDDDFQEVEAMQRLIEDRTKQVASIMVQLGFSVDTLCDELDVDYQDVQYYKYAQ